MADPPSTKDARAKSISISGDTLTVELVDGRALDAPLDWFPGLVDASEKALKKFEIVEEGKRIVWEEIGEDINLPGLMRGIAVLGND